MPSQLPRVVPDLECPSFLCQLPLPFRSQRGPFTLCVFPEHKSPVIPGWAQPVFCRAIPRRLGRQLMNAWRSQPAGEQWRLAVLPVTPPSLRGHNSSAWRLEGLSVIPGDSQESKKVYEEIPLPQPKARLRPSSPGPVSMPGAAQLGEGGLKVCHLLAV